MGGVARLVNRSAEMRIAGFDAYSKNVGSLALLAAAAVFALGLCVAAPAKSDDGAPEHADVDQDPLEQVNRFTSDFNRALREGLIDPLVDGYQYVTPEPMQRGVSNFFSNLSEPVTAVSSLLQGDAENAGNATGRFIVNSTIGLAGTYDRASDIGIEQRREDLGQAMGVSGIGSGPHIVLPILGPSNLRDATGDVLIGLVSPLPLAVHAAGTGVGYADHQDDIGSISDNALDPYVAEREAYEQNRTYAINNGVQDTPDFPTLAGPSDLKPLPETANTLK